MALDSVICRVICDSNFFVFFSHFELPQPSDFPMDWNLAGHKFLFDLTWSHISLMSILLFYTLGLLLLRKRLTIQNHSNKGWHTPGHISPEMFGRRCTKLNKNASPLDWHNWRNWYYWSLIYKCEGLFFGRTSAHLSMSLPRAADSALDIEIQKTLETHGPSFRLNNFPKIDYRKNR